MTTYYDIFSDRTPGICCNCGASVPHLVKGRRCQLCQKYWLNYHAERPARPIAAAPIWEEFRPEEVGPDGSTRCDCGKPATWWLIVPINSNGKTRLRLCDDCAALERRLALTHSWAGG